MHSQLINANVMPVKTDRGNVKDVAIPASASARGLPPLSSERRAHAWMSSNDPSSFSGRGPPKSS